MSWSHAGVYGAGRPGGDSLKRNGLLPESIYAVSHTHVPSHLLEGVHLRIEAMRALKNKRWLVILKEVDLGVIRESLCVWSDDLAD